MRQLPRLELEPAENRHPDLSRDPVAGERRVDCTSRAPQSVDHRLGDRN